MTDRQLHFNAFLMSSGHHEAAWRLPESNPFANVDLAHWRNLAQLAERARFDSLFLADSPALWNNAKHRPAGALEPTVLLTALAAVTSHIGLIATALPSGLQTFAEQVTPIFARRGLFRTAYTGRTLREHYGIPRPDSLFAAPGGRAVPAPVG